MPDEGAVESTKRFPGERLVITREAQGLSQKEVAEELNLPLRYIQWIEEGQFEKLPSLVFAKGYIRAYSKMLGVDAQEFVAKFDELHGLETRKPKPIRPVSKVEPQANLGDPLMRLTGWLFLLAMVAATVWWWKTQYSLDFIQSAETEEVSTEVKVDDNRLILPKLDDTEVVVEEPVVEETTQADPVSIVQVEEEPKYLSAAEIERLQNEMANTESNPVSQQVSSEVVSGASESAEALAVNKLVMTFSADCWLKITDATGNVLVSRVKKATDTVELTEGEAPYRLRIGNIAAVKSIVYAGQSVDLSRYSSQAGGVVTLTLPLN